MIKNDHEAALPFIYDLPPDRIAQRPVHPPESAKMLVVEPEVPLRSSSFADLPAFLRAGDLLVFNHTRVAPARIRGILAEGSAAVEFLLTTRRSSDRWVCLAKPLKKLKAGVVVRCGEKLLAQIEDRSGEKEVIVRFSARDGEGDLNSLIDQAGEMPIPPYIRRGRADSQDRTDYQSIFARVPGSIAAPTASLHFSQPLIAALAAAGIETAGVLLHLGTASFLPIYSPDESDALRPPGAEWYQHSQELLEKIRLIRSGGGRVFAVGTSVVRALESMARFQAGEGEMKESTLFIQPGFEFWLLDGIITNFHQPGTTHLLLVEAFVGSDELSRMYSFALANEFRFLSYGDGMLLLPRKPA